MREHDATQDFIDILRREQNALQQADGSLLRPLATEKSELAQQLAQLADARNRWLAMLGYLQDRIGMERALQDSPAAAEAWQKLLRLAETASHLNKINGILVGQRLRYNQQRLSALQAAANSAQTVGLYGADGQPQPFSGGRRLGEV
jgi:flagella synthesis protein FlgN